jgi:hypothetical protein
MGQGAALTTMPRSIQFLLRWAIAVSIAIAPWAISPAHACACCINNATYSLSQGADAYKVEEIRKLTSTWVTALDAGVGDSGISRAGPKASVQQELGSAGPVWRIALSEKDTATGKMQKVVLRFTPEPARKWFYVMHTTPLQNQRELSGIAHDFLMQGKVIVLSDSGKVMKNIRSITAQLVLYAKGNQCFSSQDFYAFMLDMSLLSKDNTSGKLVGEGRIAP